MPFHTSGCCAAPGWSAGNGSTRLATNQVADQVSSDAAMRLHGQPQHGALLRHHVVDDGLERVRTRPQFAVLKNSTPAARRMALLVVARELILLARACDFTLVAVHDAGHDRRPGKVLAARRRSCQAPATGRSRRPAPRSVQAGPASACGARGRRWETPRAPAWPTAPPSPAARIRARVRSTLGRGSIAATGPDLDVRSRRP